MRKIKNKKVIRRLANRSFRASQTRNIVAVLAIMLTAMLFTTLFTLGIGTVENFQRETMKQSGGDSHGVIKNLTQEQYEKLKKDPLIQESADCMVMADSVENPEFLKRHVEIWYYPPYHYPHCFIQIIDGKKPEKADEILLDKKSMELLGKEPKAGQQVTLSLQIKNSDPKPVQRTFTVSGVIQADDVMNVGFAIVSDAYRTKYAKELTYTFDQDYSLTGTIRMDVNFSNSFSIQKKLNQVIRNAGYSTNEKDKNYIASNANWAYVSDGAQTDPMTMGAIGAGLFLIILTGYLIIYNIFQISVIRDIQFYGLLKTIGATGRQIRKMIRQQAFFLCVMGIPLGLIFGFFIGKTLVPRLLAVSAYSANDVVISIHPLIFLGAALFTLFTVWISTGKPARIAAKVSPVEAVRYSDRKEGKKKEKRTMDGGKIYQMAAANLGRNKKKTILVIFSLSLAIILFNSIFTITHSFDMDKYLKKFVSSDFLIGSAHYFSDLDQYYGDDAETIGEEKLSESFVDYCKSLDGYQEGGRLYMTRMVGLQKDSWTAPKYVPIDDEGNPGMYFGNKILPLNTLDEKHWLTSFYGMEDFIYTELEVWKGESDIETIKEKLKTGKYLLASVSTDDNGFVEKDSVMHQPGDKIKLTDCHGKTREFEILSLIKENYYGLTNRIGQTFGYYTDASVFKKMVSDQFLMSFAFNAKKEKEAEIATELKQYTTDVEPTMHYESKMYWLEQFSEVKGLFLLIGGVLAGVIGFIGLLNFINSIVTGIVTRQAEFAVLEAIGMTKKQLSRMLVLEGIYYALATMVGSFVIGSLFSITALRTLADGLWFMKYNFTAIPMLLLFPMLLILGVLVPILSFCFFKKVSVVERLRKYND